VLDSSYIDKIVALESSVDAFKEKIRGFNPTAPMIGLNSKKYNDAEDADHEDQCSPASLLDEAMIEDTSNDDSDGSDDLMDALEASNTDSPIVSR
jgi:hypothetical protein